MGEMAILAIDAEVPVHGRNGEAFVARRLQRADRLVLQAFNRVLSAATRARFLPHAYDDRTVERLLGRSEAGEDLVLGLFEAPAGAQPRMVGYFFLWNFRERVPLLGIGLLDACQGLGLGGTLMRLLLAQARARGCEGVELTTLPDNDRTFARYSWSARRRHPQLRGSTTGDQNESPFQKNGTLDYRSNRSRMKHAS